MSESETKGGCHCGAVTFAVRGEPSFSFLCHCDNCRKIHGGARLAGVSFAHDGLTVTGEPKRYTYAGGKAEIEAAFCGECGTPLYAVPAAYENVVVIRANSLEDQNAFPPRKSIYGDQACAWDLLLGSAATK